MSALQYAEKSLEATNKALSTAQTHLNTVNTYQSDHRAIEIVKQQAAELVTQINMIKNHALVNLGAHLKHTVGSNDKDFDCFIEGFLKTNEMDSKLVEECMIITMDEQCALGKPRSENTLKITKQVLEQTFLHLELINLLEPQDIDIGTIGLETHDIIKQLEIVKTCALKNLGAHFAHVIGKNTDDIQQVLFGLGKISL